MNRFGVRDLGCDVGEQWEDAGFEMRDAGKAFGLRPLLIAPSRITPSRIPNQVRVPHPASRITAFSAKCPILSGPSKPLISQEKRLLPQVIHRKTQCGTWVRHAECRLRVRIYV